jgi:DNA-binding transcriptional regulator LsrR (DeoR family)
MPRYSEDLLVAVAHFYYIEGFTQEEVARRLNLSRIAVTRMLKRAREKDIVQVSIKQPLPALYQLGLDLEKRFHLQMVRVVPARATPGETLDALGRGGAELLNGLIRPGCRIGAAWSETVSAILPYIRRLPERFPCIVNELAGTYLAPDVSYSVSWPLAKALGAPLESIPVPVLVKSEEAKNVMLQEEMIRKSLSNATRVDAAFVGLGNISENSSLARTGYIQDPHIEELRQKGAVGDILMRYYDAAGRHIRMSFDPRIISLTWEHIRKLPLIVAMAFGSHKIEAIRGALRGRIIHGLVTDKGTAEALLAAADDGGNGA